MSNPNAAFGLRPVRHYAGGLVRTNEYAIADAYNTGLYCGDPVVCTGTGKNIQIATGSSSSVISGVFAGCKYRNLLGDTIFSKYWPASQATFNSEGATAEVYDDPWILFEVMTDATGIAAADVRQFANLHSGTGVNASGLSGWYLTTPTTTENQTKIMGLANCVNAGGVANAYGAYAVAEVLVLFHELRGNGQEL